MEKAKVCRTATIQIQLEYVFKPDITDEKINDVLESLNRNEFYFEFPEEYKKDSFKLISIEND